MKRTLLALALLSLLVASAHAEYVNGYTRSNGTYVQGYNRTSADSSLYNNYSTRGNTNPYTGQAGTVNPNSYSNSGYGNSGYNSYNTYGRRGY